VRPEGNLLRGKAENGRGEEDSGGSELHGVDSYSIYFDIGICDESKIAFRERVDTTPRIKSLRTYTVTAPSLNTYLPFGPRKGWTSALKRFYSYEVLRHRCHAIYGFLWLYFRA
jgi:hypothetical protein